MRDIVVIGSGHNGLIAAAYLLSPDAAGSGFQTLAIAGSLHAVGLPVVTGGSANLVRALERLITDHGGQVTTRADVERIVTKSGRAVGIIANGARIDARRAVIANTTPTQLYGRLLADGDAPAEAVLQAQRYRYNARAGMQIHMALSAPLRSRHSRRALEIHRSATAFARTGVLMIRTPTAANTTSRAAVNLAPRSRIRNFSPSV